MCDSAGHNGLSSFDNTLVLWGGGNPSASCSNKRKRLEGADNCQQSVLPQMNNAKWISENSFQLKWHAAGLCFISWCFLGENEHRKVLLCLKKLDVSLSLYSKLLFPYNPSVKPHYCTYSCFLSCMSNYTRTITTHTHRKYVEPLKWSALIFYEMWSALCLNEITQF